MSSRTGRPARPLPVHGGTPGLVRPVRIGKNYLDSTEVPTLGVHTDDASGPARGVRNGHAAARPGLVRSQRCAGGARRSRHRQDGARRARPRPRASSWGSAWSPRWGRSPRRSSRSLACTSCARRCWTRVDALPEPQQAALWRGVRAAGRCRAGPVPGRARRPQPAGRGRRGGAAAVPGRRCAVAGRGVRAGPGVRGAAGRRREGGAAVRGARHRRGRAIIGSPGCPSCAWQGSSETDARALLATAVHTPLDDAVRDRIVAEARGQPARPAGAAPRHRTPRMLAGGFALPDARGVPRRIEDSFRRRSAGLPAATQLLLLVAAADPTGDVGLLWRAAARLWASPARRPHRPRPQGCWRSTLGCGSAIRWCARRSTGPRRRRTTAAPTPRWRPPPTRSPTPTGAPGTARRRCWAPTRKPPPSWSARQAGRARRGGLAAAAAFLQQAAQLTPDPAAPGEPGAGSRARQARCRAPPTPLWNCWRSPRTGRWTPCSTLDSQLLRRSDRVPPDAERRRSRDAAGRGQDARSAGRRTVPRDLPACARCGRHHRRPRRGYRGGGRGGSQPRLRPPGTGATGRTCCSTAW